MANLDLGCNSFTGWNKITFKDSKLLFNIVNAFLSYHVPHDSMTPLCFNIISGRYTIHSFIKILLFFVKKEPYTFDGKILLKKIRVFVFIFYYYFFPQSICFLPPLFTLVNMKTVQKSKRTKSAKYHQMLKFY